EDGRRDHARELRDLLVRRGAGDRLAGDRPVDPRPHRALWRGHLVARGVAAPGRAAIGRPGSPIRRTSAGRAGDRGRGGARDGGAVTVGRAVVAFGRFWWDFLVGDTPEP